MGSQGLLIVVDDGVEPPDVTGAFDDVSVTTATPGRVTQQLCRTAVDCLVVPASLEQNEGDRIAWAARQLYPDLPVVVYGQDVGAVAVGTPVQATTLTDDAVLDAIRSALETETLAARPPSRAETLLASVFDQFPVHLFVKDRDGKHVMSSDHLVDPSRLVGQADNEVNDDEPEIFREAIYDDDRRVIDNASTLEDVEEYSRKYDVHLITSKVPWRDTDGDVLGLAGISRDITERKRREERFRASNERLRRVALKAAHELRNELQVASGRLELVESDSPILSEVGLSHMRLAEIVDDVVQLAERSASHQDQVELRLSAVVREVWGTMDTDQMTLSIGDDGLFLAEPDSVRILFETLITNAREYAGEASIVTVGRFDDGIFFEDDGDGLDVDPPKRVFEAGFSGDQKNSGLGLYIAKRIATDNGWEMTAGPAENDGARFELSGVEFRD